MKALRYHGPRNLRLDDIEEPVCGKNQVKLNPEFTGICGTDLHEYLDDPHLVPMAGPHPLTGDKAPVTLGHEFSATVVEVGTEVTDVQPGDQVVVHPLLYDSTCAACRRGRVNCCEQSGTIGFHGSTTGGLAQRIVVPKENVFKLPSNVSLEEGALIEPLAVAWHAVKNSPFQAGDSTLVIGAGPVGLAVVQVLKALGADKIIVSEISSRRQEMARHFGATHILDPKTYEGVDTAAKQCKDICDGEGPAIVLDAAGVQAGLDLALKASCVGATIVNIAMWQNPPVVDSLALLLGEKKYVGTLVHLKEDFAQVIKAVASGAIQPKAMISSVVALDEAVEKGFKALVADKDTLVKVLVKVQNA